MKFILQMVTEKRQFGRGTRAKEEAIIVVEN